MGQVKLKSLLRWIDSSGPHDIFTSCTWLSETSLDRDFESARRHGCIFIARLINAFSSRTAPTLSQDSVQSMFLYYADHNYRSL